jgi:signal transduction histidine kinase
MRLRSIMARVVALHVVTIAATALLIPLAVYWLLDKAANNLHREALQTHAISFSNFLRPEPNGGVALALPEDVKAVYSGVYGLYHFAVLDADGKVLFSSRPDRSALFPHNDDTVQDWFLRRLSSGVEIFGVSVPRSIGERIYWVQVGQDLAHRDVIIDDLVTSFFPGIAWVTLPILLVLLVIDILIFRSVLAPVRAASTTAAAIGPTRTDVRLSEARMPAEVVPLVRAVNQALERLDAGFRAQREFTADMAHELRTPLSIVRARVDSLDPGPVRDALRSDLINMTRTVNQVLDIAELESFIVDEQARADLHEVCAEAVGFMAPLAIDQGKSVSLVGAPGPVWVHGHSEALFRAVRNLVENAIRHTPKGASIEVEVSEQGTVRVLDDGPGVAAIDRDSIFRRFWRRDRDRSGGRGLGLAIVARVAAAHEGSVSVGDRPGGGAVFTLRLRPA